MNYLRAKLEGEAEEVISGLTLTNANYEEAIKLLQKCFGQNKIIINAHYTKLMNLAKTLYESKKLLKFIETVNILLTQINIQEKG